MNAIYIESSYDDSAAIYVRTRSGWRLRALINYDPKQDNEWTARMSESDMVHARHICHYHGVEIVKK